LSDNQKLVSGYQKQLEAYKVSERSMMGIYIIIDVGKLGKKGETLFKLKNARTLNGQPSSEIVLIDGSIKKPASKL
jgi:hypothetical protein